MNQRGKLTLVLPTKKYAASYLRALKSFAREKVERQIAAGPDKLQIFFTLKDFPLYKKIANQERKGINLEKGKVPSSLYWVIRGNKAIGRVSIRHKLNEKLRTIGGHIGYSLIPEERGKGYGTEMLRLALIKAKSLGIKKVFITCDETNLASKGVILANGGVLAGKIANPEKGVPKLQFWITQK